VDPIGRGESKKVKDGELEVTLLNNAVTMDGPLSANTNGAVVLFDGKWDSGKTFVLRLEGEGAANLWVQSEGDLSPEMGSIGALFPRATAAQTINIPAVQPELIAAGASINRNQWPTRAGSTARVQGRLQSLALLDSVAWFSSAGPTALGSIKPDILAPGAFVAGALSLKADPDLSPFSLFADTAMCGGVTQCAVVDDFHAVTTGTSMSSPIVAGAVALLFQRDPTLTHVQARQLLQAGARTLDQSVAVEPDARSGAGIVDGIGSLDALQLMQTPEARTPSDTHTTILLGGEFLRPTPDSKIQGLLQLRDKDGRPVGGVSNRRLALRTNNARIATALKEEVPGLYSFQLRGVPASGGKQAEVTLLFDDHVLATKAIPVALDSSAADEGYQVSGGCSLKRVTQSAGLSRQGLSYQGLSYQGLGALVLLCCLRRRVPRKKSYSQRLD
jgi:hypothetical protein